MTGEKSPDWTRLPIRSTWKFWFCIAVGLFFLYLLIWQTVLFFGISFMSLIVITVTQLFYGKNNWIKLILVLGWILIVVIIAQTLEPPIGDGGISV